jgi:ribonuclease P protein component
MADRCLPRHARLLRRADFVALRGASVRCATACFVAEYCPNPTGGARLGIAVSRRVSKLAVERNRLRRLIRESFRHHRSAIPALDVLIVARLRAAQEPNAALRAELATLWRRLAAPLNERPSPGTMRADS